MGRFRRSCIKRAVRFSRHATLNSLIKQMLGSLDLSLMLVPCALYRTDGKHTNGVTLIPWKMGKQLVWPWKHRVLWTRIFVTRLSKLLSFTRRSMRWQLFSSNRSQWQCGLCPGKCERQGDSKFVEFFFYKTVIAFHDKH